ncbi:MAG: LacI family DNA-binding transcriptional regulator, partial [Phycisphaerales bacterium]|nr:LacI family DNA-binding transcriptional regulator [Phycisphaerales bacterium]
SGHGLRGMVRRDTNSPETVSVGASIKDVAREAGVSIATVSRVINNSGSVTDATADRVRLAIDALGYRPNRFAQGLVTKRSRVIGIALPDLHGEFYAELMHRADTRAEEAGYQLLVSSGAQRPELRLRGTLALDLMDGLVTMVTESDGPALDHVRSLGLPVVVIGSDLGAQGFDAITFDNRSGTEEATRHLLRTTSPAHCWYVGGHRGNLDSDERAIEFARVLRDAGSADASSRVHHGEFSVEWGRRWTESMIEAGRLHGAAVLAGNDEIAIGIVDAARDAGIDVPDGLRVVGFDDSRLCTMLRPTLSSVQVPIREAGATAIDLILSRLAEPTRPPEHVRLATRLVERQSSRERRA